MIAVSSLALRWQIGAKPFRSIANHHVGTVYCLRVFTGPGNPGKSFDIKHFFPGLESPGILIQVLESPGNLNLATSF